MSIVFLMGFAIGIGLTLLMIFAGFKVRDREWWEQREREISALYSSVNKVVAENAQLRVALAVTELTEDAKKMAAMSRASGQVRLRAHSPNLSVVVPGHVPQQSKTRLPNPRGCEVHRPGGNTGLDHC